ncbi:MAG: S1C family serine protease [Terriglobia bacterium]
MGDANVLQEFSNATASAVEQASQAVVALNSRRHMLAAGVHWREGLIVTANHTVRREGEIQALLPDGRTASATLVGRDPSTDLALLRAPSAGLGLPAMGDPAALKVGHVVLAVGRVETGPRASLGVIGVLGAAWKTWQGGQIDQLIRLGFELHPTLSGGMLADTAGRCLGINTTGLSHSLGVSISGYLYGGMGFPGITGLPHSLGVTIPAATVNRVVDLLLKKGRIPRGYLGVGLSPVEIPAALQSRLALPETRGLIVQHVEAGGSAEEAGILMGDILVRLNSEPVAGIRELRSLLSAEVVGTSAKAVVIRAGALAELDIMVAERAS